MTEPFFRELGTTELVPVAWRDPDARAFNPTIVAADDGYILFYRVVSARIGRRIGACRLGPDLAIVAESAVAFSDHVVGAPDWQADPRLFRLGGNVWVSWNTGIIGGEDNDQYLCRIDPVSLLPIGRPRRIITRFARRQVEKNWMFFDDDGLRAIYAPQPHVVLGGTITSDEARFDTRVKTWWRPARVLAGLHEPRGGAQPVVHRGEYYHFCHAVQRTPEGFDYLALLYTFAPGSPYSVRRFATRPLDLPNPHGTRFRLPKLSDRVRSVVYPTGAVRTAADDGWLIAYGLNDEACCLATLDDSAVEAVLAPVAAVPGWRWVLADRLRKLPGYLRRKLG